MKYRAQWFWIAALLGVALLVVLIVGGRRPADQTSQSPSSYSPLPYGTKAFYTTLQRLGYQPRRWRMDWQRLGQEKGILLYAPSDPLTAQGQYRPFSASAAGELARWVERGNTLLFFLGADEREHPHGLLDQFDLTLRFESPLAEHSTPPTLQQFLPARMERDFDNVMPLPWTAGIRRVTTDTAPAFTADRGHAVVLGDTGEYASVWVAPFGKGRLYVFSSAGMIDNDFLVRSDNLTLMLNILDREGSRGGTAWFDEYHHGFSDEFGAAGFLRLPMVRFASLQALLLCGLFVFVSCQRFGRPVPMSRPGQRSIHEYTQSLGDLYQRAGTHREILEFLFQELRQSLCSRYNLPDTAPHAWIEDRLRARHGAAEAWRQLADDCDRLLARKRIADRDLVVVARKIEELRNRIA